MIFPHSEWLSSVAMGFISAGSVAAVAFFNGHLNGVDVGNTAFLAGVIAAVAYHGGLADGRKQK